MAAELDPLSELRFLTEALRAHAEWQQVCGGGALPPAGNLRSAVGVEAGAPSAEPQHREPKHREPKHRESKRREPKRREPKHRASSKRRARARRRATRSPP